MVIGIVVDDVVGVASDLGWRDAHAALLVPPETRDTAHQVTWTHDSKPISFNPNVLQ